MLIDELKIDILVYFCGCISSASSADQTIARQRSSSIARCSLLRCLFSDQPHTLQQLESVFISRHLDRNHACRKRAPVLPGTTVTPYVSRSYRALHNLSFLFLESDILCYPSNGEIICLCINYLRNNYCYSLYNL